MSATGGGRLVFMVEIMTKERYQGGSESKSVILIREVRFSRGSVFKQDNDLYHTQSLVNKFLVDSNGKVLSGLQRHQI